MTLTTIDKKLDYFINDGSRRHKDIINPEKSPKIVRSDCETSKNCPKRKKDYNEIGLFFH
ncbi:hypothetical protein DERF_003031 [Dermatophagoides farinae]|uniref:Uncharacterized protein n=1 Tax=Dermatophagoides farinae TaxID=6954 RepID=A0A922ICU4_DERFA|nr:hypothetical protein DERF_003031 [Dermatophagoides farinae]